jgi:hypothetical protein
VSTLRVGAAPKLVVGVALATWASASGAKINEVGAAAAVVKVQVWLAGRALPAASLAPVVTVAV